MRLLGHWLVLSLDPSLSLPPYLRIILTMLRAVLAVPQHTKLEPPEHQEIEFCSGHGIIHILGPGRNGSIHMKENRFCEFYASMNFHSDWFILVNAGLVLIFMEACFL